MSQVPALAPPLERSEPSLAGPEYRWETQQPQHVWQRTLELADPFDEHHLFTVVLEVLRTSRHDVATMTQALAVGHSHLRQHRADLIAWRAIRLLERAVAFLGGESRSGELGAVGLAR